MVALHDFLPEDQLRNVENLHEFAGMLVFDKWTCNTNGRQAVFFYEGAAAPGQPEWRYEARMIDQGFCFNAGRVLASVGPFLTGYLVTALGSFGRAASAVALIYLVGLLILPFAPETKGQPLPE